MKKIKNIVMFCAILFLVFLFPSKANANNDDAINTYGNGEYALTSYDVVINVNENNTFYIIENISAYFNVRKHGIFRKIPLRNEVVRLDGTKSRNRAIISKIYVDDNYSLSTSNGYKVIKIGHDNRTLIGQNDYQIGYLYNIGKDTGKGYDELYFNIIGDEWDTTISGISFTINMPKEFDESKLGFSSGKKGSTDSSNITYNVDGNVITGKYNGVLNAGEALTVRLELPDGYFVCASDNSNKMIFLLYVLPIVFLGISFVLWFKYGRDDKIPETVEFYPPKGFNSAEIGFLYKGRAENNDVISLIIYLANKGYIRIEEYGVKKLLSTKKEFKIVKIKDYDGDNINEKLFLDGLFSSQGRLAVNPEVTADDLYDNFYVFLNKIVKDLNDKKNKSKIFDKFKVRISYAILLMIIISFITIIAIPTLDTAGGEQLGMIVFMTFIFIPFYAVLFSKKIGILFRVFWGFFLVPFTITFFMGLPIKEALYYDSAILKGFLFGLFCTLGMLFCFKTMSTRTLYGNVMLAKIKGFRTFLKVAEKPRLEALVMQNPTYFYNILPYTYVLGISDKWIKKFESIALQNPSWYDGTDVLDATYFGSFMNSTMASASKAMSSSPSSSDDGGSSGGGSSGGGSGGGGGGSW